MSKLVLASHGLFCEELKNSVEMILGEQENIYTLPLLPSDGEEDFVNKFDVIRKETNGEELTVFVDLFGGTPSNQISKYVMQGENIQLYAGMNMPMVINFINAQLIGQAPDTVNEGVAGIKHVNELLPRL